MEISNLMMQTKYGPPMTPLSQLHIILPQILLLITFPATIVIGYLIYKRKKKAKQNRK